MDNAGISRHISEHNRCAVIVAHPDDETLWAGGTIMLHPQAQWTVVAICRKSDHDRASRFLRAMEEMGAAGAMGDLDDGPEQTPLNLRELKSTIIELLAADRFDLVITHGNRGEYTRHLRHEETGKAVLSLCESGRLFAKQIWRFAYEDGDGKYLPRPIQDADLLVELPEGIWQKKYNIITEIYGFGPDSFEAKTTPCTEAFWCFRRV